MPVMWDSRKPSGSATATGPGSQPTKLVPPPTLKQRAFRSQTTPLQPSRSQPRFEDETHSPDDTYDREFWQNDFDNRLNGLGIQNGPSRYEIRRGKTVPRPPSTKPPKLSHPIDSDSQEAPPIQPPPPRNPRRLNPHDWRPTSSLYIDDEDSHLDLQTAPSKSKAPARDMYGRPTLDISPPSSPEFGAERYGAYPEDVSPIDEGPDLSQRELLYGAQNLAPPHEPQSHIPTMRREKRADPKRPVPDLKESRSQERLRDPQSEAFHPWDNGPAQEHAANQPAYGFTTTVTGPQVHRSGNPTPSLGQRMRQLTRGKTEPIENRPPWKGASGRAPLVDPVRDDLVVAPLTVKRQQSRRGGRPGVVQPETSNSAAATVRRLLPSRSNQKLKEVSKTPSPEPSSHGPSAHAYPSPPYHDYPISSSHAPAPPTHPAQAKPLPSPRVHDSDKSIRRKPSPSTYIPPPDSRHSIPSSLISSYTDQSVATYVPPLSTAAPSSPFTPDDPWVPPPSRFSVTTCNTTAPDSPYEVVEEERPPMPTPPKQLPSMMDRRRPVPGSDRSNTPPANEPIVISIKSSLGSSSKTETSRTGSGRPSSIVSTSKALPMVPPEKQSANDRVAHLNARLESLAHRRININKGIRQMTELMPTDGLMSSAEVLRKREIEKQKVETLKEELAEIQREEYDLGLKLYRANKRLERESDFEGSALWVRRATTE